jgi:hypothetical protein
MRREIRRATADDYDEPLRSMILRGEAEVPDELVIEDREDPRIGRAEYLREHGDGGDGPHPAQDRYEKWLDGPPDMG